MVTAYIIRITLMLLFIAILFAQLYYILTRAKKVSPTPQPSRQQVENSFPKEKSRKIIELIETTFEQNKVYLSQGYTLDDLSRELSINKSYLSKAMNAYQIDFTTLLNYLRIKEAKIILCSDVGNNYTIEAVSSLVGYKSKSSFNHHFKKDTGLTPKQYRKINA